MLLVIQAKENLVLTLGMNYQKILRESNFQMKTINLIMMRIKKKLEFDNENKLINIENIKFEQGVN